MITVATKKMTRSHATSFNIGLVLITITKDDDHDNVSEDIGDDHDVDDHEGVDPTTAIKDTAWRNINQDLLFALSTKPFHIFLILNSLMVISSHIPMGIA